MENHVDSASIGWMQSVTIDTPREEMRVRYERDGYLWVKNLMPREDVLDMREHQVQTYIQAQLIIPDCLPTVTFNNFLLLEFSFRSLPLEMESSIPPTTPFCIKVLVGLPSKRASSYSTSFTQHPFIVAFSLTLLSAVLFETLCVGERRS